MQLRERLEDMNLIAAVNSDWGIGYNNAQSIVIPEDRRNFQNLTRNSVVIAGRKTFEGFGRPLPNRKNIVLSRDRGFKAGGIIVAHSIDEVLAITSDENAEKVFVIGGGSVYNQFLSMCTYAYITRISAKPPSDAYFPNLDESPHWALESRGATSESKGIRYSFDIYKNNAIAAG